jgi:hypothetical protein
MFSRFRTVGKKPATTKLPSQKAPIKRDPFMELIQKEKSVKQLRQSFGDAPNKLPLMSLTQERIAKLARQKESLKMKSNIFRVRKAIKNVYPSGLKGINNPRKLAQANLL